MDKKHYGSISQHNIEEFTKELTKIASDKPKFRIVWVGYHELIHGTKVGIYEAIYEWEGKEKIEPGMGTAV
jgi:hypothetical protein